MSKLQEKCRQEYKGDFMSILQECKKFTFYSSTQSSLSHSEKKTREKLAIERQMLK